MAVRVDSTTVSLPVPAAYGGRVAQLLSEIEQLPVEPDTIARILIDERSGIIVMGDNVRISRVAVAQGNLTVRVSETPQVSQPNPLADGRTVEVPRTNIEVDTQSGNRMVALEPGVTLRDLVDGLNALRDLAPVAYEQVALFGNALDNVDNLHLTGEFVTFQLDSTYSGVLIMFDLPVFRKIISTDTVDCDAVAWADGGLTT